MSELTGNDTPTEQQYEVVTGGLTVPLAVSMMVLSFAALVGFESLVGYAAPPAIAAIAAYIAYSDYEVVAPHVQ